MKRLWAGLVLVLLATVAGCGGDEDAGPTDADTDDDAGLVADAPEVTAMAALADGGLVFGERVTGRVLQADAAGEVEPDPLVTLPVSTEAQRGLVGLAVDDQGRVFAAWTDDEVGDQPLLVAQVSPGGVRLVWRGPPSTDEATGGRIAFDADGRLLVAVGDLLGGDARLDPTTVNGKLLALDPDGPPDQEPALVSLGWNNPFALAVTPSGDLWIADNSPGEEPERLARADTGGGPPADVTDIGRHTVPSGLAAIDDRTLVLCRFTTGQLTEFEVGDDGRATEGRALADDCTLGVVVLSDGRIAYSDGGSIRVVER